jgi:N4-gp56 family major capsid protein
MKNIFDLQLFAYDPQAQPANNTGANGATPAANLTYEMKTFYDMTLIEAAGPNLVHAQFGQKKPIPKGKGKTIEFRKFNKLGKVTSALTEGVTPDPQNLRVDHIEATVSQYGGFVALTDMLELTAIDPIIVETVKLIGDQAGLSMDTVVRNVLQGGTNVSYADKTVAGVLTPVTSRANLDETAKISVDGIEKVVAKLKRANAQKINGDYIAIVHPDVVYDLRRDPDWINAVEYGRPEDLYMSEVGRLAGVRFVESTEAKIYKDSTCPSYTEGGSTKYLAVYGCLFVAADAYGVTEIEGGGLETLVANKQASVADPLAQRSTVGWKATGTAELLLPENLVRFECCSTFSKTAEAN